MNLSLHAIYRVWVRYFAVYQKNWFYGVTTTFVEPALYLVSFGFGLGSLISGVHLDGHEVSYRAFVLAGILGQTLLMQAFFEAAYGAFIRMYYQRIFQSIAVTPVTLAEVLWGELLWDATRAMFSASVVLGTGVALGDFSLLGALVLLPCSFFFALTFASMGLLVAANSRTIESISYPQYLIVFPMFLFCGVFFPLNQLPMWLQWPVSFLPLACHLSLIHAALLGADFHVLPVVMSAVWLCIFLPWSRRAMTKRLVC